MTKIVQYFIAPLSGFVIALSSFSTLADTPTDAERLLNWAELTYPDLFPQPQATQILDPWLYRYYPTTGIYAGINQADQGIYVLGGPWGGSPVYIESVSNMINFAFPSGSWLGALPVHEISTATNSDDIRVAISSNGDAVVVWLENDPGLSIESVWAIHYNSVADAWGQAVLLDTGAQSARNPRVAMDANGNAIVVWMQQLGIEFNATAARYNAGTGWEQPVLLENENSAINGGVPQIDIAMNNAGNAVAVWSQRTGVQSYTYANRYIAGQGWSGAVSIDPDTAGQIDFSFNPKIAMDNSGNAIAVWSGPRVNRYSVASNAWEAVPQQIGAGIEADIAMGSNGDAILTTQVRGGLASQSRITAWHFTPQSGWDTTGRILDEGRVEEAESIVQVAMDATGDAVAVWSQRDSGGVISAFANRFNAGTGWGGPTPIESNNEDIASGINVTMDSSGNAYAIWRQYNPATFTSRNWTSTSNSAGQWQTAPFGVAVVDGALSTPRIVANASGRAISAWVQMFEIDRDRHIFLMVNNRC
ncbi:MAG: hypothetical protein IPG31_03365 [Nitrosomonas sp.]|nr:hypothetical protein [Nitrosomonas sp.]